MVGASFLPPARRRFATWSGQKLSGPMSEELNLGCRVAAEGTNGRTDRVSHPLLALPEKVAAKWRDCEKDFAAEQSVFWREGIQSIIDQKDFAAVFGSGFNRAHSTY